jgi:hypothetical protein
MKLILGIVFIILSIVLIIISRRMDDNFYSYMEGEYIFQDIEYCDIDVMFGEVCLN